MTASERSVDWDALTAAATAVAQQAYVPYSHFRVGAAALVDDGRVISGCNVENVSYGLSQCAEVSLVGVLHSTGGGRLVAVATVAGDGSPVMPCGRCRQVLLEHGGAGCLVNGDGSVRTVAEVLPFAFDADSMIGRTDS